MSQKSRSAWWAVALFAICLACVLTLNILRKQDVIDSETKGLLQLLVSGFIFTILIVTSIRTSISPLLRFAILFTLSAALVETVLDYTEHVPALNVTPLVGRNSVSRPTIEAILAATWMFGGFSIICIAMISVQRWQEDSSQRIDELRSSEHKLTQSNERLAAALVELKDTQRQLVQRERLTALGQMASGVAHDLNNTLAPVVAFSQLLTQSRNDLTDEQKTWLTCIEQCALDAVSTIDGLQQFNHDNSRSSSPQTVALNELVEQVIDVTRPKWKDEPERSGQCIAVDVDLADCSAVQVNPAEFRVVLTNLVFNAVEAMPDGGTLSLRLYEQDERVVLSVSDTGTGMNDEAIKRCFEPFYTTKTRGSGLGLSVCHGFVNRHGGTVDVESDREGTTFIVRLPACGTPLTEPACVAPPKQADHGQQRILLVDDDDAVRHSTTVLLDSLGTEVVAARDGESGIAAFRDQGPFDLVITDLGMAGIDGVALVRAIREQNPQQKIAVVSGWSEQEVRRRFPDGELPDIVLHKPAMSDQMLELIRGCSVS